MIASLAVLFAAQNQVIRIACVGDSITVGVGSPRPGTSYPAQLQTMLGPGYDVRVFARSGATMLKRGSLPITAQPEFRLLPAFEPNIIVLLLGSNDAAVRNWPSLGSEFASDYASVVRAFLRAQLKPAVFVCTPPPVFGSHLADSGRYLDPEVIPILRQVARREGCQVIDFRTALDGKPQLFADGEHLNEAGYAAMATTVYEAVVDTRPMKRAWKLVAFSSQQSDEGPAKNAIDGDPETYWHTQFEPTAARPPHSMVVDTGHTQWISGFRYLPRQDGGVNGLARDFSFEISTDKLRWSTPSADVQRGANSDPTKLRFAIPERMRYFRFTIKSGVGGYGSAAELDILPTPASQIPNGPLMMRTGRR